MRFVLACLLICGALRHSEALRIPRFRAHRGVRRTGIGSKLPTRNGGSGGAVPPPNFFALFSSGMDEGGEGNEGGNSGGKDVNKELEDVFDRLEDGKNPISRQWSKLPEETRTDILTTGSSFLFAVIVRLLIIEPRFIPSLSMFPTFNIGDQLLVDKVGKFSRGSQGYLKRDVVVFNPPEAYTDLTGNDEALIKRIVATEGDSVEVKGNRLYINGALQVCTNNM